MAVAFEDFVKGLEQSGIVSPDSLRAVCEKLPPNRQNDAQELARELVRQKILTTYQVKEAYQGKAKDLVLGNYIILDQIGQGGMGQVFKAQHRKMKRLVAIKLLPAAMTKDQTAINRFQREVEAAAKLEHPNIVTAHDADEANGRHFLVMQYVEGTDLSVLVKKNGPLPVEQAVGYTLQAARGLEFAHGEGVVHRDIKPANLLLDKKGVVKVLDMGLARFESAAGAEQAELTGTGQIMGTVDYMSPEQALDTKHANERSDIYSLGCTFWYLVTGRAAFGGESVMAKLLAHREQPIPSLQTTCPGATPALETVFTKMLAKKEEDRYQSMNEVVANLERVSSCQVAAAQPATRDTGSVGDGQSEDHRMSEFLRGTNPSWSASSGASVKLAAATQRPSTPVLNATITLAGPQIETDPKTEQSLVVPAAGSAWWKNWRVSVGRPRLLVACAVGAVALLLAGIILYLETRQGTVRIEIIDPGIEVVVDGQGATIKGARSKEIKLQPGKHSLRIKYGELDFETDKFILDRADTVVLKVELLAGKVQVVQGDTVLGERPLPVPAVAPIPAPAIAPFDAQQAKRHQQEWSEYLKLSVEYTNSIGMKFVLIPPGEFTMGSTPAEIEEALKFLGGDKHSQECFKSEAPQHKVILTQPFYLGTHEVTQEEYEQVMGRNPSFFANTGPEKQWVEKVEGLDTASHPVEGVSWNEAAEFCAKLSEKEKLKPFYFRNGESVTMLVGTGYRLASEAEWEFACRAGTTTKYWFGDQDEDFSQADWFGTNSGNRTHQVGELRANPFGLYDIHGNVREWVQDGWESPYYRQFQDRPALNPSGPSSAGSWRVIRGGYWLNHPSGCRASSRFADDPRSRTSTIGFRLVKAIEPQAPGGNAAKASSSAAPKRPDTEPPSRAIAPFDAQQAKAHQEAWAKHLATKVEIENSLGMKLRLIPPGEFLMGSPQDEIDALVEITTSPLLQSLYRSEGPQHRVNLTRAFYLGCCEVTQQQYQEVMGDNPSHFSLTGAGKDALKDLVDTSQLPVELVSWFDAVEFCNKLSEKEQRPPYYLRDAERVVVLGGTGYRLPTEAEWEYACRAGATTRWSFGDNEQDLATHGWFSSNLGNRTHPVAALSANPFGLYDLHGNVTEWCWDWHGEYAAGPVIDSTGAITGSNRAFRGGGWSDVATFCRSASRVYTQPTLRHGYLGFRVAKSIDAISEVLPTAATGGSPTPAIDTDPGKANVNPPKSAIAHFDAKQALAHQEAWAQHLGTKVEIENSLGMKLRLIPPGEFMMGSPQEEIDALVATTTEPQWWQDLFRSEGPRHRVKLTQAFYLGNCEVTQKQYQELMGVNPSHFSPTGSGKDAVKDLETSQHPVEMVSWFDAVDFCNKLSEREKRSPYYLTVGEGLIEVLGGAGYRLPTEAEWEFACRAGTTTRWSFGDTERDLAQHAWFPANSNGRTQRVGELPANPFGLHDLYGNVWEWCWDWHGKYAAGAVSDPMGSAAGSARVVRGGAYNGGLASYCRSAIRGVDVPVSLSRYGFRMSCGL